MPNWFVYDENGVKKGPISNPQLKRLADSRRITPETIIETEDGRRGKAGQIRGLFSHSVQALQSQIHPFDAKINSLTLKEPGSNQFRRSSKFLLIGFLALVLLSITVPASYYYETHLSSNSSGYETYGIGHNTDTHNDHPKRIGRMFSLDSPFGVAFWVLLIILSLMFYYATKTKNGIKKKNTSPKFCPHCGVPLSPEQVICVKCGCKVR